MKRETALAIFRLQLVAGIAFAVLGSAFGLFIYSKFRDSGVPNGANGTLSAASVALTVVGISIVAGGLASYVAKVCIRRFK